MKLDNQELKLENNKIKGKYEKVLIKNSLLLQDRELTGKGSPVYEGTGEIGQLQKELSNLQILCREQGEALTHSIHQLQEQQRDNCELKAYLDEHMRGRQPAAEYSTNDLSSSDFCRQLRGDTVVVREANETWDDILNESNEPSARRKTFPNLTYPESIVDQKISDIGLKLNRLNKAIASNTKALRTKITSPKSSRTPATESIIDVHRKKVINISLGLSKQHN